MIEEIDLMESAKMDWARPFVRGYAGPLDRSSIFYSMEDAQNYAKGVLHQDEEPNDYEAEDIRGLGKTAYPGQIISVYSEDTSTMDICIITPEGRVKGISEIVNSINVHSTYYVFENVETLFDESNEELVAEAPVGAVFFVVNGNGDNRMPETFVKVHDEEGGSVLMTTTPFVVSETEPTGEYANHKAQPMWIDTRFMNTAENFDVDLLTGKMEDGTAVTGADFAKLKDIVTQMAYILGVDFDSGDLKDFKREDAHVFPLITSLYAPENREFEGDDPGSMPDSLKDIADVVTYDYSIKDKIDEVMAEHDIDFSNSYKVKIIEDKSLADTDDGDVRYMIRVFVEANGHEYFKTFDIEDASLCEILHDYNTWVEVEERYKTVVNKETTGEGEIIETEEEVLDDVVAAVKRYDGDVRYYDTETGEEVLEKLTDDIKNISKYFVKAIRIKRGTYREMMDVSDCLLEGELIWCQYDATDPTHSNKLFIKTKDRNGNLVFQNIGGGGGGGNSGEDMPYLTELKDIEKIDWKAKDSGAAFREYVDNQGNIHVIDYGADGNISSTNASGKRKYPMFFINTIYCGGIGSNKNMFRPCSHNFVELSNLTGLDINLEKAGVTLQYVDKESCFDTATNKMMWKMLPLKGVIKAGSTYLIRGAECAPMDANTTRLKIDTYDQEWFDEDGKLVSFSTKNPFFILLQGDKDEEGNLLTATHAIDDVWKDNKYFYDPSKGFLNGNFDSVGIKGKVAGVEQPDPLYCENAPVAMMSDISETYNAVFVKYFTMDPANQAQVAAKDGRNGKKDMYMVNLMADFEENISENFKGMASWEGKTLFSTKAQYADTPNMVACSFGKKATDDGNGATRCFNWVSKNYYDEYVELTYPDGHTEYYESFKNPGQAGIYTGQPKETFVLSDNHYYDKDDDGNDVPNRFSTNGIYDRFRTFTSYGQNITVHKFIIDGLRAGTYTYRVGRTGFWSEPYTFTVRTDQDVNENGFSVIHHSDEQGFNHDEYVAWKYLAEYANAKYDRISIVESFDEYQTVSEGLAEHGTGDIFTVRDSASAEFDVTSLVNAVPDTVTNPDYQFRVTDTNIEMTAVSADESTVDKSFTVKLSEAIDKCLADADAYVEVETEDGSKVKTTTYEIDSAYCEIDGTSLKFRMYDTNNIGDDLTFKISPDYYVLSYRSDERMVNEIGEDVQNSGFLIQNGTLTLNYRQFGVNQSFSKSMGYTNAALKLAVSNNFVFATDYEDGTLTVRYFLNTMTNHYVVGGGTTVPMNMTKKEYPDTAITGEPDGNVVYVTSAPEGWYVIANGNPVKIAKKYENPKYHFTIDTGDMTQSGNRTNEWLDYYWGGICMWNHTEQMNTVGNNDLAPEDNAKNGLGGDTDKINPKNFDLFYTYDLTLGEQELLCVKMRDESMKLIPSYYSFDYGKYHFACVNTEIPTDTIRLLYDGMDMTDAESMKNASKFDPERNPVNIITNIEHWLDDDFKAIAEYNDSLGNTYNGRKQIIVYCHEMPFTIQTIDKMKEDHSEAKGSERAGGCRIQYIESKYQPMLENPTTPVENLTGRKYWLSRLMEKYHVQLMLGGHKHTYSSSLHIKENVITQNGKEKYTLTMRPKCQLKRSMLQEVYGTGLTDAELVDMWWNDGTDMNGNYYNEEFPTLWQNNICAKEDVEVVDEYDCPQYVMCQASGYKLVSNKELPGFVIPWLTIPEGNPLMHHMSRTYFMKSASGNTPHPNQLFPIFILWTFKVDPVTGKDIIIGVPKRMSKQTASGKGLIYYKGNTSATGTYNMINKVGWKDDIENWNAETADGESLRQEILIMNKPFITTNPYNMDA